MSLRGPRHRALEARAAPFVDAGVLGADAVSVVGLLADGVGDGDVDRALGCAFALDAPRHGHIGIDLCRAPTLVGRAMGGAGTVDPLPWPDDLGAWVEKVATSALVDDMRPSPWTDGDVARPFALRPSLLAPARFVDAERRVAQALVRRARLPVLLDGDKLGESAPWLRASLERYWPEPSMQSRAALRSLCHPWTFIAGGPGTGKTHTLAHLLLLIWEWARETKRRSTPSVLLCAPTGKATARMKEAIRARVADERLPEEAREFASNVAATTLHRALGIRPDAPEGTRRVLPYEWVIVDEASMVDITLFAALLEATSETTRLVIVGDRHQLASVESGAVLTDIWASARPESATLPKGAALPNVSVERSVLAECMVELDKPYRFGRESAIAALASSIVAADKDGISRTLAEASREWSLEGEGVALVPFSASVLSQIARAYGGLRSADVRSALDALARVRVLAPLRRSERGVDVLNQRFFVETFGNVAPRRLVPGTPLLVTRNHEESGLRNGDTGVAALEKGIPVGVFSSDDGSLRSVEDGRLPPWELAFVMSVHKSQGSQFDHTVVVLPERMHPLLTRELMYTAVTRAKSKLTLVGDGALVGEAAMRPIERATELREWVQWELGRTT